MDPEGVIRGTSRDDALLIGAGAIYLGRLGAELFLVSDAARAGETAVIDGQPGDRVQFAPGLGIAGFTLTATGAPKSLNEKELSDISGL